MTGLPANVLPLGCEGLLPATVIGSRGASRVRILQGRFAGLSGLVVRIHHVGAVDVRFIDGPTALVGRELPFGRSELEVIS